MCQHIESIQLSPQSMYAVMQELCWILDARLMAIREAWHSRRLQKAGLHQQDVERLVRALFEDTEMRRSVLGGLRQVQEVPPSST